MGARGTKSSRAVEFSLRDALAHLASWLHLQNPLASVKGKLVRNNGRDNDSLDRIDNRDYRTYLLNRIINDLYRPPLPSHEVTLHYRPRWVRISALCRERNLWRCPE